MNPKAKTRITSAFSASICRTSAKNKRAQLKGKGALRSAAEDSQKSGYDRATSEVPPIVHEVLRSPGQSLDGETRDILNLVSGMTSVGYEGIRMQRR
jgi:hypothetical protein